MLQQRYVHSLQAAIKPRLPKPLPAAKPIEPPTLDIKWARPVGSRPDVDEAVEQMIAGESLDWSRLGYVQLAKEYSELCSAVMLLADLHEMKSPAKRILMFPRAWLRKSDEDEYDPEMNTMRRLLRTAARRYGVTLIPMETIVDDADGEGSGSARLCLQLTLSSLPALFLFSRQSVCTDELRADHLSPGSGRLARRVSARFAACFFQVGAHGCIPSDARKKGALDVAAHGSSVP